MKSFLIDSSLPRLYRRNEGIALVTVLAMLAILVMLVVAIFSLSRSELNSSNLQAKHENGREMADVAVNLVMGQIRAATRRPVGDTPTFWASQPGAIRRYNMDGTFNKGYRLYSSAKMEVTGAETQMLSDATPRDWQSYPLVYVDLNEPIIRPGQTGGQSAGAYFPIIDPRAFVPSKSDLSFDSATGEPTGIANPNVEGFFYDASQVEGAIAATDELADTGARLPMPVEWLYVRKDGTFCSILPGSNSFVAPDGSPLSEDEARANPIIARIAFWTDDETCKVNINTASEPTFWATPHMVHNRDMSWAHYQPTAFEYQRYPGHPAGVALSSVLFPNTPMDMYFASSPAAKLAIQTRKESIYSLVPKINRGGSISGTVPIWKFVDDFNGWQDMSYYKKTVDLQESIKERLFSSPDEMLFAELSGTSDQRDLVKMVDPTSGDPGGANFFTDPQQLERVRFFLTAQSRAPETTIYGTPKVSIWPVSDESRAGENQARPSFYRTGFDNMIAYASTLRPTGVGGGSVNHSYFFRRANSNTWFNNQNLPQDVDIPRNANLLAYLKGMMAATYPGGGSFSSKWGEDADQVLIEIFDYIRMTNLYDGFLRPASSVLEDESTSNPYRTDGVVYRDAGGGAGGRNGSTVDEIYRLSQRNRPVNNFRTYTPDRASRNITTTDQADTIPGVPRNSQREVEGDLSFPGHGQVVPSKWNGKQGIGRFLTLTEAGFQFICSGDGDTDKGSFPRIVKNPAFDSSMPPGPANPEFKEDTSVLAGGRSALMIKEHTGDGSGRAEPIRYKDSFTFQDKIRVWHSNFPVQPSRATQLSWGLDPSAPAGDPRNPLTKDPNTGLPYHPGMNPQNWNASLDFSPRTGGIALKPGEKRVQGLFVMEFTLLSPGYPQINPDFTVVVRGLDQTTLDSKKLYTDTGSNVIVWKSGQRAMDYNSSRGLGGSINQFAMYSGRRVKSTIPTINSDPNYDAAASGGNGGPHDGLLNFDLATKFVTTTGSTMTFSGASITIELYSSHEISPTNLVQTYQLAIPGKNLPTPELITMSSDHEQWTDANNNISIQLPIHAPSWWAFNYFGVLGRFANAANGGFTQLADRGDANLDRQLGGRLYPRNTNQDRLSRGNVPRGKASIWAYDRNNGNYNSALMKQISPAPDNDSDVFSDTGLVDNSPPGSNAPTPRGTDVVYTMVPKHSDFRLLAAKNVVPASDWVIHPKAQNLGATDPLNGNDKNMVAHSLARYNSQSEAGFARDAAPFANRLVEGANYTGGRIPDIPPYVATSAPAKMYGDFDNAVGDVRDGCWINKPDEGSATLLFRFKDSKVARWVNAYIGGYDEWIAGDPGETLMTPNRMIASPVMFGSLPTGVQRDLPWQTLLFRAYTPPKGGAANHPGEASYFGGTSPADHNLLDLFTMPVVEPYAITENFSTAGKINMNYQMVPFGRSRPTAVSTVAPSATSTYIRRSTALHALMKGEVMSAIPLNDANKYKGGYPSGALREKDNYVYRQAWTDTTDAGSYGGLKKWHRKIELEQRAARGGALQGTLVQFEDRFNFNTTSWSPAQAQGLFRTPSQICEIHLIPRKLSGAVATDGGDGGGTTPYTAAQCAAFWGSAGASGRGLTGDNLKERVYSNLYARLTTQSNTYRVYFRAQMLAKARSSAPTEFDPTRDTVTSDYRGSALVERKLDVNNIAIPDYGASVSPIALESLENFYRLRVLETKRFVP